MCTKIVRTRIDVATGTRCWSMLCLRLTTEAFNVHTVSEMEMDRYHPLGGEPSNKQLNAASILI